MNREQVKKYIASKEIILFGAGNYARQFYREFHGRLHIAYCLSNNTKEEVFLVDGKEICPVQRADTAMISESQLVILCAACYREMEAQMRDKGYRNGVHYIDSQLVYFLFSDRKIAIFYGVCYMRALYSCMVASTDFSRKYAAFYWLDYRRLAPEEYELYSFLLPLCDLFVYTVNISFEKSRRNQSYLSRLPGKCKKVSIPLIPFNGYHPRTEGTVGEENPYSVVSIKTYYGSFIIPDTNVNQFIKEGKAYDEIVKTIGDPDFYSKSWLEENFAGEVRKLRFAERLSDIKIVDYVLEKHGKERLFLNETHISNPVVIELAGRILSQIGLKRDLPVDKLREKCLLYTTEVPLYPSVIEHLDLEVYKRNPTYRLFTFGREMDVTFEEYIRRYYEYSSSMKKWIDEGYFPR